MACQKPLQINGHTVACMSCDHCVGRRIHQWCARAMMEKESMGHALVVALTYSERTEHSRRSAQMFDYKDVQDLIRNLRRQVDYHFDRRSVVSFIAAGEKGDRTDRCHWHLVLFSEVDLTQIGKWSAPWGRVHARSEIITPDGEEARRRDWSLWDHGFVTVQEPDYGGMRYALAYALKDQFNVRNAMKSGRALKAETFGTGYLVMSKKPPIGARWVDAYVDRCRAAGVVPPTRKLKVEGLDKPFWPSGFLSERLLSGLVQVNAEVLEATGKPALGWSTLLHETRESEKLREILGVPLEQEEEEKPDDRSATHGLRLDERHRFAGWQAARERWHAREEAARQHRQASSDEARAERSGAASGDSDQKKASGNGGY